MRSCCFLKISEDMRNLVPIWGLRGCAELSVVCSYAINRLGIQIKARSVRVAIYGVSRVVFSQTSGMVTITDLRDHPRYVVSDSFNPLDRVALTAIRRSWWPMAVLDAEYFYTIGKP